MMNDDNDDDEAQAERGVRGRASVLAASGLAATYTVRGIRGLWAVGTTEREALPSWQHLVSADSGVGA